MTNMAGTEIFFKFPLITQEVVIKYFQKLFSICSGSLETLVTDLSDIWLISPRLFAREKDNKPVEKRVVSNVLLYLYSWNL